MTMPRTVHSETLDGLAENDPAAMHARRDLRRIHRLMATRTLLTRALRGLPVWLRARGRSGPLRILELGAGDGTLMLGVARALRRRWPAVEFTLLDRQNLVSAATIAGYADAGWSAAPEVCDVLDWSAAPANLHTQFPAGRWDLIVCNLFLHHFEGAQLRALLAAIESRTERFFACEPRRGRLALAASHLVGLIGANAVTREDAVLSVHAGFHGDELTRIWPAAGPGWELAEAPAGLFSHCFCALRHVAGEFAAPGQAR